MWRGFFLAACTASAAAGTASLLALGPTADLLPFLRVLAIAALLGLAVLVPVAASLAAHGRALPLRAGVRFLVREAPFAGAMMLMLGVSTALAAVPFAGGLSVPLALAVVVLGLAGAAAASLEHLFPYVPAPAQRPGSAT